MHNTRVKVFTDIPDDATLKALIDDYKDSGASRVGWKRQDDGRFRVEIMFDEESPLPSRGTISSPVSGESLHLA
jgi:hypothetical protein